MAKRAPNVGPERVGARGGGKGRNPDERPPREGEIVVVGISPTESSREVGTESEGDTPTRTGAAEKMGAIGGGCDGRMPSRSLP